MIKFQSKIDALRMFHAIAKPLPEYAGGTHLMRHVAHYAEKHRKKYEVTLTHELKLS